MDGINSKVLVASATKFQDAEEEINEKIKKLGSGWKVANVTSFIHSVGDYSHLTMVTLAQKITPK
jgi:hypothetical protein